MTLDKLIVKASLDIGMHFKLPSSISEAQRRIKQGVVYIKPKVNDITWIQVLDYKLEINKPTYLRFGKHKYIYIDREFNVWNTESRIDPFIDL